MSVSRYKEYKPAGTQWINSVPSHWRVEKLKFVASNNSSNVDKHSFEDEIPVRLCNYTDVYYNEFITDDLDFMEATATEQEIERFRLLPGDVIITKDSESWDDIAIPALVSEPLNNVLCGYHLSHIRPNEEHIVGRYLYWLLCSETINRQFQVSANGVTRFGLPKYHIDNAILLVPPIEEQHAIADFLEEKTKDFDSTVMRIGGSKALDVASEDSWIGLIRKYKSALVTAATTGQIRVA